jgi:D-alanyl-D-alanine carboxypeptidase
MIFRINRLLAGTTLAFVSAFAALPAFAKVHHTTPVEGTYAGAIVIDATSGQVLLEENADVVSPPASMTKLMTFAVLHDKLADGSLKLDTPVHVDVSDSKMGGTQVYLDPRETFPVEELIYAMMVQSANDAAHALARASAGSVEAFVGLMNAKARELGMAHTTFRTPHGLPPRSRRISDGDLTTPRDFAVLSRYLVRNTDVLKYTSVKERQFGTGVRPQPMRMDNHNKLLGKVSGVDGLKTGYTESAGYCLSATAERNGRRIIAVIMGSFGPNRSIDKGRARDLKTIELISRGFAALPATADPQAGRVAVTAKPVKPAASPAQPPAAQAPTTTVTSAETVPTVSTDKSAPPAEQSSTVSEPVVTFRVIPPSKP